MILALTPVSLSFNINGSRGIKTHDGGNAFTWTRNVFGAKEVVMDVTLLSAVFFCNVTAVVFSVNCCCCCVVGLTSLDLIRRRVIFASGISFLRVLLCQVGGWC